MRRRADLAEEAAAALRVLPGAPRAGLADGGADGCGESAGVAAVDSPAEAVTARAAAVVAPVEVSPLLASAELCDKLDGVDCWSCGCGSW